MRAFCLSVAAVPEMWYTFSRNALLTGKTGGNCRFHPAHPAPGQSKQPTRGIDVGARADFYKIINELVSEDIGVIVISSEEDELIGLCNRIIVMREGEKVGEFHAEEPDLKAKMMKLMIGIE